MQAMLASWITGLSNLLIWRNVLSVVMVVVLVLLLALPILRYLFAGWIAKRDELMSYFNDVLVVEYFKQFLPTEGLDGAAARQEFEKIYDSRLGRRLYLVPTVLIVIVVVFEAIAASGTALKAIGAVDKVDLYLPDIALSAIAGGYMWVVSDFIIRMRGRNLSPSDIYQATLRLVISAPLGYSFAQIAAKDVGPFIAFALGAFPLEPLMSLLRRLTYKRLGIDETAEEASDQLVKLQGINSSIAERFRNEDIFTISQLADEDPVRLSMRTNLSFNFVLDCVSQALAWCYFGEQLNLIRPFGLRGAFEIRTLISQMDNADPDDEAVRDRERAEELLPMVATAINIDPLLLEHAFREIALDPYTAFLHNIWH